MNSFLWSLCLALAIALGVVLTVLGFPSEFWNIKITDVLLVVATVALVGSTIGLWLSGQWTSEITQRGYVKMSHTPPGVIWGPTGLTVTIQVSNAGKTPAALTGLLLKTFLLEPNDQLPPRPDYSTNDPPEPQEGFLAAEDKIFVTRTFHLADGDVEAVRSGLLTLYLLGYVDYVDIFEKPHRAGYARVYDVGRRDTTNNLAVVPNNRYNYDEPLPGWA